MVVRVQVSPSAPNKVLNLRGLRNYRVNPFLRVVLVKLPVLRQRLSHGCHKEGKMAVYRRGEKWVEMDCRIQMVYTLTRKDAGCWESLLLTRSESVFYD